jgi:hypothetical protein
VSIVESDFLYKRIVKLVFHEVFVVVYSIVGTPKIVGHGIVLAYILIWSWDVVWSWGFVVS